MTKAALDALVARLNSLAEWSERGHLVSAEKLRRAAAAITALRKREVTEAMVEAAVQATWGAPGLKAEVTAPLRYEMRRAIEAALAQAEVEKK